ncbi:MAG TPA: M55 family metallopeptidase [Patescibacteria group bacterium]|nr:M55 family metallopeptidase [Patescibacteria group bacterium]
MSKKNAKVIISVDMEGITSIVSGNMTGTSQPDYGMGRSLMAGDVNAAIEGILEASDASITVSEGHGGMKNIRPEELHEAATLVRGTPKPLSQICGIDGSFDAAMFIGYHSKKGTLHGTLSHTYSGRAIHSLTVNGMEIGETALNAAVAGYYGVPLVLVAGDLAVTKEAKELNPKIVTVAVKEAVSRTAAKTLHPRVAREMIRRGAIKAMGKIDSIEPFTFEPPIEMYVKFTNAQMADGVEFMPTAERIDGRTIKFVLDDYIKAFGAFIASVAIAGAVSS